MELIPADVAGWTAVVAAMVALALMLRRLDPNRNVVVADVPMTAQPIGEFAKGVEFQQVMKVSLTELEGAPDLRSIQADAKRQIDAAEHAFNRLLAECASVSAPVVASTFEPARELVREPAAVPAQQQPLAA